MKRRAHEDASDALDMFLDTVCNLLGIIIFLAVLMAILASATSQTIVEKQTTALSQLEQEVLQELDRQRETIDDRVDQYLQHESLQESRILTENEETLVLAQAEVERRELIIAEYDKQLAASVSELRELGDSVEGLQQEVESLRARHAAASQLTNRRLRTPQTTNVKTMPTTLILVNGRLYAPNDWSKNNRSGKITLSDWCSAMTSFRPSDVNIPKSSTSGCQFRSGSDALRRTIALQSNGGLPIDLKQTLADMPEWGRIIADFNPRQHHLLITVATNSFKEFALVRAAISELGFKYKIIHAEETFAETLVHEDSFVSGQPTAQ